MRIRLSHTGIWRPSFKKSIFYYFLVEIRFHEFMYEVHIWPLKTAIDVLWKHIAKTCYFQESRAEWQSWNIAEQRFYRINKITNRWQVEINFPGVSRIQVPKHITGLVYRQGIKHVTWHVKCLNYKSSVTWSPSIKFQIFLQELEDCDLWYRCKNN